jgi:hypothetical protein
VTTAVKIAHLALSGTPSPRPVASQTASPAPEGWWIMPGADAWLRTETRPDGTVTVTGMMEGVYAATDDGFWYDTDADGGYRLRFDGDEVRLGMEIRPWRDFVFRRCAAPDTSVPTPAGVYLSPELRTLASIRDDGTYQLGLDLAGRLEPGPDGTHLAGPAALRADGDDLLVSMLGAERIRFVRQPEGTAPVGVPLGLSAS